MELGIWQILSSSEITDILLDSGFSTIILDLEHGDHSLNSLKACIHTSRGHRGVNVLARFPSSSHELLTQAIDSGIDGILVSHTESIDDIIRVKDAVCTYPKGHRSFSPFVSRYHYGKSTISDVDEPSLGILVESVKGLEEASSMIDTGYVDFVYFGAYDLSVEEGVPGDIFAPGVVDHLRYLTEICKNKEVQIMSLYRDLKELNTLRSLGVDVYIAGVDTGHIANHFTSAVEQFKGIYDLVQ